MTTDEMRALAEQCISHPASRTTGDIERAGMAIVELMEPREKLNTQRAGLGGFFTDAMLSAATLNGEREGRAYRGYCPKCGNHTLKNIHREPGIVAKSCIACGVLVLLSDA